MNEYLEIIGWAMVFDMWLVGVLTLVYGLYKLYKRYHVRHHRWYPPKETLLHM